jgi:hypothetical protein
MGTGPKCCDQVGSAKFPQRLNSSFDDSPNKSFPAGVYRSHCWAVAVDNGNWRTVGGVDREHCIGVHRYERVAFEANTVARPSNAVHNIAVHLSQPRPLAAMHGVATNH